MLKSLRELYVSLWIVVVGAPIAFLLPVIGEGIQHIAEFQLGMFDVGDGLSVGAETTTRLSFGAIKVASVFAAILLSVQFLDKQEGSSRRPLSTWFAIVTRYDAFSFVLLIAAVVPAMAVHYGLNYFAFGKPPGLVVALLAFDTLVVGALAVLLGAAVQLMAAAFDRAEA